jgi:hypothetical protein
LDRIRALETLGFRRRRSILFSFEKHKIRALKSGLVLDSFNSLNNARRTLWPKVLLQMARRRSIYTLHTVYRKGKSTESKVLLPSSDLS